MAANSTYIRGKTLNRDDAYFGNILNEKAFINHCEEQCGDSYEPSEQSVAVLEEIMRKIVQSTAQSMRTLVDKKTIKDSHLRTMLELRANYRPDFQDIVNVLKRYDEFMAEVNKEDGKDQNSEEGKENDGDNENSTGDQEEGDKEKASKSKQSATNKASASKIDVSQSEEDSDSGEKDKRPKGKAPVESGKGKTAKTKQTAKTKKNVQSQTKRKNKKKKEEEDDEEVASTPPPSPKKNKNKKQVGRHAQDVDDRWT